MLDVYLEDDVIVITLPREQRILCDVCNQEAFIFQDEGNFCLNCWQDRTEPDIDQEALMQDLSYDSRAFEPAYDIKS